MPASPEYVAMQAADATFRETMSILVLGGGATKPCCPLCSEVHPCCRFDPGSLFCAESPCGNPHHRPRS